MRTETDAATAGSWKTTGLSKPVILGGVFIILSVFIAYWPALRGGFIWDDDAYVTANPLLTASEGWWRIWFSAHSQSQYFPMVYTTLRIERALWGLNPLGYHLVNVALHGMNALLAWILLRRLAVPGAWLAAALFALHPVQVESAAWITELKNTQSTLFCLLSLLAWTKFTDQTAAPRARVFYALALVLHALALFSKTTACTLPAAMLLVLWLRNQPIGRRWLVQVAPFVVLGVLMGLLSVWWEGHLGNYISDSGVRLTLLERLLIATRALWFYAGKLIWPANLAFSYPRWEIDIHDVRQYGWGLACLALIAVLWSCRRKVGRGAIAAPVFYAVTLSPLLGFFPLYTFYYSFVADHYQYFACLGPIALAAAILTRAADRRRLSPRWQGAIHLALLFALGALTLQRAANFRDQESLWRDTLKKNPDSCLALNNLGRVLLERGQIAAAEKYFRQALQLHPHDADILYNVGKAVAASGRIDEGISYYEQALQFKPHSATLRFNFGNLLVGARRYDEAIAQFQLALKLKPADADIHNNLAVVFYSTRRLDQAVAEFREAVACRPDSASFHCNFGNALFAQRKLDDAVQEYTKALAIDPDHAEAKARLRTLGVPVISPRENVKIDDNKN